MEGKKFDSYERRTNRNLYCRLVILISTYNANSNS
jgi:hypothetical protein